MKRASPVILQRQAVGYNEISDEMMYPIGLGPTSSGSNERNLTPLSQRHRADEGS